GPPPSTMVSQVDSMIWVYRGAPWAGTARGAEGPRGQGAKGGNGSRYETDRSVTRPGPGLTFAWQARRCVSVLSKISSTSSSARAGGSRCSPPASTSTRHVPQLAERHEKGTGA